MSSKTHEVQRHSIPTDILNDLCTRFIINLPEEDKESLVRICFQIELAHWFYLDYYCTDESYKVEACNIRKFAAHIFRYVPQLQKHVHSLNDVIDFWRDYKQSVPTYGAILLDQGLTHVLLVQSYWTKASWGFPKGKVNEKEKPDECAIREVFEETGFDITHYLKENEYIETTVHDQTIRLYIIYNIPLETKFYPRTRNEIKACEWFKISDLPSHKKDMTPKQKIGLGPNSFFMVMPFLKRIRRWIYERNPKVFVNSARRMRHKSLSDIETPTKTKPKQISEGLELEISKFQQNSEEKTAKNLVKTTPVPRKEKKHSKRQLFTPQHDYSNVPIFSNKLMPDDYDDEYLALINYKSPCWENFKFDRAEILASFH